MTKTTKIDLRVTFDNQEIEIDGTVVRFDGKYNPITDTLKVYRFYGDITLREQALQDFAISRVYGTVNYLI